MDITFVIFFLYLIGTVLCGEYCVDDGEIFYCNYDCCGSYGDEYCCGVYSWIIAVAVIGSIALISFLVIVYCVWKKHNTKPGRVINNAPQGQNMQVIHVPPQQFPPGYQNQPQQFPPGYQNQPHGFQPQPPPYQPQTQGMYPPPPPANYGADPAYPPDK